MAMKMFEAKANTKDRKNVEQKVSATCMIMIISALIPFLIIFDSVKFNAFDQSFYRSEFEKNDVYSKLPNADEISSNLLFYLKYGDGTISSTDYSEKEISHLVDVRVLIQKGLLLLKILAVLFVVLIPALYFVSKKHFLTNISKALMYGGIASSAVLLLFSFVFMSFSSSFVSFHKIFFSNDNWLLSFDDTLIKLFPQQFFFDVAFRIFAFSIIASVAILLAGLAGYLYFKKQK